MRRCGSCGNTWAETPPAPPRVTGDTTVRELVEALRARGGAKLTIEPGPEGALITVAARGVTITRPGPSDAEAVPGAIAALDLVVVTLLRGGS